jgi:methyl-accepting chemotaxis protein
VTIKLKLIILLVIPTTGILFLGIQGFLQSSTVAAQMREIEELSNLAVKISQMVHETQKERGRTAGFLGSKGEKFQAELPAQQAEADRKIAEFNKFMADFDAEHYGQEFKAALTAATRDLGQITSNRQAIMNLSMSTKDAIGYYTKMNGRFLNTIHTITGQSRNAELTVAISAYVSFLKGKERAGIERAVLSGTFANGAFEPGVYKKFIALVTEQNTYFDDFQLAASGDLVAFYDEKMQAPAVAQVQTYRQAAYEHATQGEFGVDAGVWFDTITQKINLLKEVEDNLSDSLGAQASSARHTAVTGQWFFAGLSLGIVAISVLGGVVVIRSVIGPIREIIARLQDIAQGEGDLTKRVDEERKDELGELGQWFNRFVERVHDIIAEVAGSTSEVASAATQIAASSEEMAVSLGNQRKQVDEISSTIADMSGSIVEVARKSSEASSNAQESGQVAQAGGDVVNQTIEGMRSISAAVTASATSVRELGSRGEQIGQIIDVINDIADQTNLLALNAAIEAARAGEHGRGFAVVADEVRKLADRTTKATDEITGSIEAIQTETSQAVERMNAGTEEVDTGMIKAGEAGESLNKIVTRAADVSSMIQAIASAAEQQSASSEQITRSIDSVNASSAQASEGAEQSAMAANQLSKKAEALQGIVSQFKLSA